MKIHLWLATKSNASKAWVIIQCEWKQFMVRGTNNFNKKKTLKKVETTCAFSVPRLSTHAPNSWVHFFFEARHSQKQTMNANRQDPGWASASELLTPLKCERRPPPSPLCCFQHFRPKCEKVRAFTVVLCCVNLGCIIALQVDILSVEFSYVISCPLVTSGPGFLWLSLRLGQQWLMWSNEPRWQPVCGPCPSRAVQAHASCCVHLQTRAQTDTGWGPRHKLDRAKSLAAHQGGYVQQTYVFCQTGRITSGSGLSHVLR